MKIKVVFFLICVPVLCSSQSNGMLRRMALQSEMAKDWYSAAQYYQRLYFSDTTNTRIRFSYAEASRLALDNEVALRLYLGVAAADNGRRFPMSFYWIGHGYKTRGDYKRAGHWFEKFSKLKNKKENLSYYRLRARQETDHCDYAQIIMREPVIPELEHITSTVNTRVSEYAPFEHDSALYFSSLRFPERRNPRMAAPEVYNKIYRSNIRNGRYMKSYALDTIINANLLHNANLCYSPASDMLVMSRCTALNFSDYQCDLYISRLVSRHWQIPYKMEEPVNLEGFSTTQPHLAVVDTQLYLFFSSNRPGGQGGMDIWYSVWKKDGSYSPPQNAGKMINTPEDEVTPWFVSGEQSLYFSSTYHGGLGGLDIFRSKYGSSGFSAAQNAGHPLNSGHNDLYYSVNEDSRRAYLASNRPGSYSDNKNNCCNDIYMFSFDTIPPPPEIDTMLLKREKMKLLVPLTLFFHNDEPDPRTTNTVTEQSYEQTHEKYMAMIPLYEKEFAKDLNKHERQQALDAVNNFFTDSVQNGLEDLQKFVKLMKPLLEGGDTIKITMQGYCSPLASSDYNKNLAKRRISSLRNYFRSVNDGELLRYIEGDGPGRILFEDVDVGELKASRASDNFRDKRSSVYHPFAASERKIQIIAVSFGGGTVE